MPVGICRKPWGSGVIGMVSNVFLLALLEEMCTGPGKDLAKPDLDRHQILQAGWVYNKLAGTKTPGLPEFSDGAHRARTALVAAWQGGWFLHTPPPQQASQEEVASQVRTERPVREQSLGLLGPGVRSPVWVEWCLEARG